MFDAKRGTKPVEPAADPEKLYTEIGRLKFELDWLKKIRSIPMSKCRQWISDNEPLPVAKQCALASVNRSTVYLPSIVLFPDAEELRLLELIDQEYTRHPFYGTRKIMHYLRNEGYKINRKRVQRLMRILGLAGMAPGPNTSKPHPEHKIYPYLLRGVDVTKPNQVWSTDISVPQKAV